jgi:FkbM family methyltransferase
VIKWNSHLWIFLRARFRNTFLKTILKTFIYGNKYEDKYSKALIAQLRSNDIVWDIGANIGLYSVEFAKNLSSDGHVYAFEPVPEIFLKLTENVSLHPQVSCLNLAISDINGFAFIEKGQDPHLATSKIVDVQSKESIQIQIYTGDELIRLGKAQNPTFLKIDVEGHELSVIKGLIQILASNPPRVIGMEVHFEKLSQIGEKFGPQVIVQTLEQVYRIKWLDPSHIICTLKNPMT